MLCGEGSHLKGKYPSEGTGELMVEFAKGLGFPDSSVGKESAYNAGDSGSIPGSGRSAGEGIGYHSSILAWRIPWTSPWGPKELDTTE